VEATGFPFELVASQSDFASVEGGGVASGIYTFIDKVAGWKAQAWHCTLLDCNITEPLFLDLICVENFQDLYCCHGNQLRTSRYSGGKQKHRGNVGRQTLLDAMSYYSRNGSESYTTQGLSPPSATPCFRLVVVTLSSLLMDGSISEHGEKDESRAKIKWKRKGDDDGGMWTNKQKRRTRPADRMNGPAQHANPVHQKIGLSVWLRLAPKPLVHPACSTILHGCRRSLSPVIKYRLVVGLNAMLVAPSA